jgi:membrane protein implicated in regulation of membrane protease activity
MNGNCRTSMQNQFEFVLKVLLLSTGLSALIKYVLPGLPIPATATNALIIVFLPTVVMAGILLWRFQRQQN